MRGLARGNGWREEKSGQTGGRRRDQLTPANGADNLNLVITEFYQPILANSSPNSPATITSTICPNSHSPSVVIHPVCYDPHSPSVATHSHPICCDPPAANCADIRTANCRILYRFRWCTEYGKNRIYEEHLKTKPNIARGRQRTTWTVNIYEWTGLIYIVRR